MRQYLIYLAVLFSGFGLGWFAAALFIMSKISALAEEVAFWESLFKRLHIGFDLICDREIAKLKARPKI